MNLMRGNGEQENCEVKSHVLELVGFFYWRDTGLAVDFIVRRRVMKLNLILMEYGIMRLCGDLLPHKPHKNIQSAVSSDISDRNGRGGYMDV